MNGNEKVIAALGGASSPAGTDADDKARIAELEKQLQTERVEHGRLKREIERNAQLEDEIRRLKSGSAAKEAADSLTDDELNGTPREFLEAGGIVAANLVAKAQGRTDEEIQKLRREIDEREQNAFIGQIGMQNQKFFSDVGPGGDKSGMWDAFKASNRETFDAVMQTRDVSRFNMLVNSFYREIGVRNPSGEGRTTASSPSTAGVQTAHDADDGQTFSHEEYLRKLEEAEEMRRGGDMEGWRRVTSQLKSALGDGRVR